MPSLRASIFRGVASLLAVGLVCSSFGWFARPALAAVSRTPQAVGTFDNDTLSFVKAEDGTLYVGGIFEHANGQAREGLAKFLPDGTLDPSWHVTVYGTVYDLALDSTGRLYVAGEFAEIGGVSRNNFARVNVDGNVDTGFTANTAGGVREVEIDGSGNIFLSGMFTQIGGVNHPGLAKLNSSGVVQWSLSSFSSPLGIGLGYTMAVDPIDGGVVLGGYFDNVNGTTVSSLVKVDSSGAVVAYPGITGAFPVVNDLIAAQDGSMYIGGYFDHVGGTARQGVAHILQNGTVDSGWQADTDDASVYGVAVDADQNLYVVGSFSTVDGASRTMLALISSAGVVDPDWDPAADGLPQGTYLAGDGTLYVGGNFDHIDVTSAPRAVQFANDAGGGGGGGSSNHVRYMPGPRMDVGIERTDSGPLRSGDQVVLTWFAQQTLQLPYVDIAWSEDGGETWLPIAREPMWRSRYAWTVPDVGIIAPAARIRVTLTDGLTPDFAGVSHPFPVIPKETAQNLP